MLVQSGTLKRGDVVLAGSSFGRVRAMLDEDGKPIDEAGPSIPVEIQGLTDVPQAGDEFMVLGDERRAREIATFRQGKYRDVKLAKPPGREPREHVRPDGGRAPRQAAADHQGRRAGFAGSAGAVAAQALDRRGQGADRARGGRRHQRERHQPRDRLQGGDHRLQRAGRCRLEKLAENNGVDIRYYNIIYDAVDEIKAAMTGMLAPEQREETHRHGRDPHGVRGLEDRHGRRLHGHRGPGRRGARFRVLRDNVVIHTGELESLRRFKDDVREVKAGFECGIKLKNYNDIKEGDQFEVFEIKEVARTL